MRSSSSTSASSAGPAPPSPRGPRRAPWPYRRSREMTPSSSAWRTLALTSVAVFVVSLDRTMLFFARARAPRLPGGAPCERGGPLGRGRCAGGGDRPVPGIAHHPVLGLAVGLLH